jgi:hypothetical protein
MGHPRIGGKPGPDQGMTREHRAEALGSPGGTLGSQVSGAGGLTRRARDGPFPATTAGFQSDRRGRSGIQFVEMAIEDFEGFRGNPGPGLEEDGLLEGNSPVAGLPSRRIDPGLAMIDPVREDLGRDGSRKSRTS